MISSDDNNRRTSDHELKSFIQELAYLCHANQAEIEAQDGIMYITLYGDESCYASVEGGISGIGAKVVDIIRSEGSIGLPG